jgi:DNA-binding LacI/PurR family transcriptional regulator
MMTKGEAPLERPVRLADVAREAGVSAATASRILNGSDAFSEETRRRVWEIARRCGFVPDPVARSLRRGRGDSVALLVGDIEQRVYAGLARHMQRAVEECGLDLLLYDLAHDEARLRRFLERAPGRRLRAIALATTDTLPPDCIELLKDLAARQVRIIVLRQPVKERGIVSLVQQEAEAAREATALLLTRGGPVAFLGRITASSLGAERCEGYRQALAEAGVPADPALIWDRSFRYQAGHAAVAEALAKGLAPRGILAASDELALGAMAALQDAGLGIPGDVGVIGFGDADWGAFTRPALTTVSEDSVSLADRVRALLKDDVEEGLFVMPRHLIRRDSA